MGKASREKGKAGEREAAALLRELGFPTARRGRQYSGSPDSPDVVGIPGAHLEVKRRNKGSVGAWLLEAAEDAGPDLVPLVLHRRDRGLWMLTLHASDIWRLQTLLHRVQVRAVLDADAAQIEQRATIKDDADSA